VSTDQDGNFRVGEYFRIDQATGRATLNASAFDLAGLTSLKLGSIGAQLGELINEFSSDGTMSGNSNNAVPTEFAVKTYVDNNSGDKTVNYTSVDTITYSTIRQAPRVTAMQDTTGINFTNVTYGVIGNVQLQTVVNSYQEIKAGVTKSVSLTYNETDGSIKTITVV
jgi:hypothetical protein